MGMLRKILGAAIYKPWEDEEPESPVVGEGAPTEYEFRVHPDGDRIAVWAPRVGKWIEFADVIILDRAPLLTKRYDTWYQFLEVDLDLEP